MVPAAVHPSQATSAHGVPHVDPLELALPSLLRSSYRTRSRPVYETQTVGAGTYFCTKSQ